MRREVKNDSKVSDLDKVVGGIQFTEEGTQVEGCSGGEDGVHGVEFSTTFKVSVGTQHRDAQYTDGYVHR